MVERLNSSLPTSREGGRALDIAITALRRGEPVLLAGEYGAVLALAAEFVNEDNLQRLRDVSARPLHVVLTRRRAVALGLARRDALSGQIIQVSLSLRQGRTTCSGHCRS